MRSDHTDKIVELYAFKEKYHDLMEKTIKDCEQQAL